jgi:hypothetical protein
MMIEPLSEKHYPAVKEIYLQGIATAMLPFKPRRRNGKRGIEITCHIADW